jgi:hypothetical protein
MFKFGRERHSSHFHSAQAHAIFYHGLFLLPHLQVSRVVAIASFWPLLIEAETVVIARLAGSVVIVFFGFFGLLGSCQCVRLVVTVLD